MVNVEKGVLVEWYVAHWTTDHFLNKAYLKILWFGSFSSLVMWLLMFTLVIVNGGQHWLALAFSDSLPLYFYECLCIVQFYLANKVSSFFFFVFSAGPSQASCERRSNCADSATYEVDPEP